jgi:hypothetical protein
MEESLVWKGREGKRFDGFKRMEGAGGVVGIFACGGGRDLILDLTLGSHKRGFAERLEQRSEKPVSCRGMVAICLFEGRWLFVVGLKLHCPLEAEPEVARIAVRLV